MGDRPKARLVYLEDDEAAFELVRSLLEADAFEAELIHAYDPATFEAALVPRPPDLILSDYNLPTIDGRTALELRQRHCPQTPFIFVSGAMGEALALELLRAGVTDFVFKDALPRLVPSIRRSLAEAREQRERRLAEHSLRESEERFRRLTENAPDVIFRYSLEAMPGRCEYINQAVERISGYSVQEFYRRPLMAVRIVHPADRAIIRGLVERRQLPAEAAEIRWIAKDGRVLVTEQRFVPIRDEAGRLVAVEGIARDITERRRAEERVALLSRAIAESPVGVDITDPSGKFVFVSAAQCAMTGYTEAELLGRKPAMLVSPDNPAGHHEAICERLDRGETWHGEIICRRKDGSDRVVRTHMTPLRGRDGRVQHCIAVKEDITEWKQEQDDRRSLEAQLVQAQKLESIGTLAGGIAHDFNNILTGILGFAEIAAMSMPAGGGQSALEEVRKAGLRARDLVSQILTFSRRQEAEQVVVDLSRLVRDALKFLRASTPANITISHRLTAGNVLADPTQVHQIVLNLCTNSLHAMRDGPGVLSVSVERAVLDEAKAAQMPKVEPGDYLCLRVVDTGHGMDADTLQRVFDPFFTTKKAGEGTGLGLAVVRGIVSDHRGGILVESQPGVGTTFRVYFPLCRSEPTTATPAAPVPRGAGERVLVVDDEVSVGQFTTVRLEQQNFRAVVMVESQRALAAVRATPQRFDAIVTDHMMPGLTGVELIREIRHLRPGLPAVIVTGNRSALPADLLATMPRLVVLDKPFTGEDVARALHTVLNPAAAP